MAGRGRRGGPSRGDEDDRDRGDREREPTWPSLEEQLRASKVIPGSALEKLIRENQDFDRLRPEEAHDKLGLPPWLRVYWWKQHPELRVPAHDPTGGYPLALRDLYLWMLEHQDLEPQRGPE
jgi:hypothetical protein